MSGTAARELAYELFPENESYRREFLDKAVLPLIGNGNMELDHERTQAAQEKAKEEVDTELLEYKKGRLLIERSDEFTEEKRKLIDAERKVFPEWQQPGAMAPMLIWSLLLLLAAIGVQYWMNPRCFGDNRQILIIGIVTSLALGLNAVALESVWRLQAIIQSADSLLELAPAAVPIALAPAMLAVLIDRRTAIGVGGYIAAITAMMIMPERSFELALRWSAVGTATALVVGHRVNYSRAFFLRAFGSSFAMTLLICLNVFLEGDSWNFATGTDSAEMVRHFFLSSTAGLAFTYAFTYAFGSSFAAAVLALSFTFLFESANVTTPMSLMVLCNDSDNELRKRLIREAPGTMAHSMAVATLAEDAARKIGANPLLAQAGALFHDIGKLAMPQYFTENDQKGAAQRHQALNPQMSAKIILDHVETGLVLARRYHLCRPVRDIIATHHGDDLVRYFYDRAMDNTENDGAAPPVLETQFRYKGEPPEGAEATIVSLADACEAASRSLEHPTPERIRELVDKIFLGRFQGGQLRRSRLTLAELKAVRDSFIETLGNSYHGRISYDTPKQEEDSGENPLPVAQRASAASVEK